MNNIINRISELEKQTHQNIKEAKAKNTLRAYKSDLKIFEKFCKSLNLRSMPATEKTVSLFITELSKINKYSSIKRKLAAIKISHNLSGKYLDLKNPIINENLNSIKKKLGTYQKAKKPLLIDDLKKIIIQINKEKKINIKLRNKALILIGFSGAFRRSELVDIELNDIEFVKEGVKIFLRKSKTDQSGEGMIKAIPYLNNIDFCPVQNLKNWINFINENKFLSKKIFKMSDKNVALILKKYLDNIGLESEYYAGHSLRSGFATSAADNGIDERSIMKTTGHKSSQMVRRYIHETNLFKNNALKKMPI